MSSQSSNSDDSSLLISGPDKSQSGLEKVQNRYLKHLHMIQAKD